MKLWLDVDDLFYFARRSARPTGIQRLTGEVYAALVEADPLAVGFVVHGEPPGTFRIVEWQEVLGVYQSMTTGSKRQEGQFASADEESPAAPALHRRILARLLSRLLSEQPQGIERQEQAVRDLRRCANAGDVLLSLGAPWHHPSYADHVSHLTRDTGMRFGMLVHDLIPLLCPEYFEVGRAPNFGKFMTESLPIADILLTNSASTARDVSRWTAREGLKLKCEPRPIPIGIGFTRPPPGPLPLGLKTGEFALFVSTIEVRKNHLQVFRAWCRMLQEMPWETVPTLVFAGTVGWMVTDLMKAIESTNRLEGKLVFIQEPDDATLCALYQACRFTLFTSHYEGWGLPVSDSLAFGKVCIASDRTSIPEAGGAFCLYVDPDNTTGAYKVIRRAVENPHEIIELEERIRTTFRPVPWSATANAVLEAVS